MKSLPTLRMHMSPGSGIGSKIVLIDSAIMAQLMIDYGIAVSPVTSYEIKRIDSDYFVED